MQEAGLGKNPLQWCNAMKNILSFLSAPLTQWLEGRARIKEAKINAKVAKWNAKAEQAKRAQEITADWDLRAMEAAKESWKDELLLLIFSAPFVGSFIPGVQDAVLRGWEYVAKAPLWYQVCYAGMVAASFGLRWWFTQNRLGVIKGKLGVNSGGER